MRPLPTLAARCALLLAALVPAALPAQEVRVTGADRSRAVAVMREVLARGQYLRIDRDTVLPATFRAPGDLVVYDAEVRLAGAVEGTVVVIGGHLYLRPGARVGGPVAVVGGGVYPSGQATTGPILEAEPGTQVVLEGDSAALTDAAVLAAELDAPPRPSLVTFGPRPLPSYDRVAGGTASFGVRLNPTRAEDGGTVDAWISYRQALEDFGGGVRVEWPVGVENVRVAAEASRAVRTNDAWLRNDLSNSVSALLWGKDYRNYWDADQVRLTVHRPVGKPLVAGETWLGPRVSVLMSEDRSLAERDLWALFDDDDDLSRPNPPIAEGTVVSVSLGSELHWVGRTSRLFLDGSVEQGLPGPGDFDFTHALLFGRYEALGIARHRMVVEFRAMAPLDQGGSPPQRWGILGGSGSIPTEEVGTFRGDHLFFVESGYSIPVPRIRLPLVGSPSLELSHAAGSAWATGEDERPFVQNLGVGVAFPLFRARAIVNPADRPLDPKFSFRVSLPRR
ncbi:MAG TPA: hypothetical protein VFX98_19765 [Longimicrobiaceae bacterium]|nr:hypothetical protein [Longimicrobiaceae bacterium]